MIGSAVDLLRNNSCGLAIILPASLKENQPQNDKIEEERTLPPDLLLEKKLREESSGGYIIKRIKYRIQYFVEIITALH